jgi:hemerythrin-like domain-containing protein
MQATRILMEEHRVIERVLAALETGTQRLAAGQAVRPDFFVDVADFARGFADGCHHKKEEQVLFRTMTAHGLPGDTGPIAAMLDEHADGRQYVGAMRDAAARMASGDRVGRALVIECAQGYASLLRQHIYKEDHVLFPLADRLIPADEHDGVSAAFEKVEHEETGEGVHERYLALAQALESEMRS